MNSSTTYIARLEDVSASNTEYDFEKLYQSVRVRLEAKLSPVTFNEEVAAKVYLLLAKIAKMKKQNPGMKDCIFLDDFKLRLTGASEDIKPLDLTVKRMQVCIARFCASRKIIPRINPLAISAGIGHIDWARLWFVNGMCQAIESAPEEIVSLALARAKNHEDLGMNNDGMEELTRKGVSIVSNDRGENYMSLKKSDGTQQVINMNTVMDYLGQLKGMKRTSTSQAAASKIREFYAAYFASGQ